MLKFIVETAIDLKKSWDEAKFTKKCIKFSTLIHSQRILAEITEEAAFEIIKDPKKQELILGASEIKTSVMDKLKERILEFFKKAKDFFSRKKKNKTQEKLLKDLDTPAKLLGNIDGGYLCTQAIENYTQEYMEFDPQDPYNKKGLVKLFTTILSKIDPALYEKVIGFEEMKDFSAVTLMETEESTAHHELEVKNLEPTHEEVVSIILEDPILKSKINENSDEISIFRERQEKNEIKLKDLIQYHNEHNETLEIHEKRITALEKQAITGLNFLGGLNQEIYELNERVENLYNIMNVKYLEILNKIEEGQNPTEGNTPSKLIVRKQTSLNDDKKNDPFFMYLEKTLGKIKGSKSSVAGTPNKPLLTPLGKKS